MDLKKHGNVIIKYREIDHRLRKHGLFIKVWGRIAVAKIDEPHNNWIINNIDTIEEIEAFCEGIEYANNNFLARVDG